MLHVINYISSALNEGKFCVGVFLDLKKAFDVCNHKILLKKLNHLGVKGLALKWFTSYLSNRYQQVDIEGNLSNPKQINISVLQGSILGPILFLCYINDLPLSSNLNTYLFADDTQGLASGKNLPELIDLVNSELLKWAAWFRANKMAVNTKKTKYIVFHTKGKKINLSDKEIVWNDNDPNSSFNPSLVSKLERVHTTNPNTDSRTYKLLGILLDEHLSLDQHTSALQSKLSKSIFLINRAKNLLPPKALRTLYYSLIHSHLTYCPAIVGCTSKTNIEKISKMQKKAIRIITNSSYTAHTDPLFKQLNILTFKNIITQANLHLMHSIHYKYAPVSFNNFWQTNTSRNTQHNLRNTHDYTIPRANYSFFTRFPAHSFPTLWNSAGPSKYHENKITFQKSLKDELIGINYIAAPPHPPPSPPLPPTPTPTSSPPLPPLWHP